MAEIVIQWFCNGSEGETTVSPPAGLTHDETHEWAKRIAQVEFEWRWHYLEVPKDAS